jgi:hypothetical protein
VTNPCYTDAFVFLKTRQGQSRSLPPGSIVRAPVARPPEDWLVVRGHHEPYISWEEFWTTQECLRENTSKSTGAPRSGPAFLSHLLSCGHCGYAMVVHYGRRSRGVLQGSYECGQGRARRAPLCHSVSTASLDRPVVQAVLQTLAQLTESAVAEALAQEQALHTHHGQLRAHAVREAEAAVALAERRYKAVDPANTLVARQLEHEYEKALRQREQRALTQASVPEPALPVAGPAEVPLLLAVAADVQRVWAHPAVTNEERKEVLRALIERIVLHEPTPGAITLSVRWHGGAVSTVQAYRSTFVRQRILELWHQGVTAQAIAATLDAEGVRTAQQRTWAGKTVEYVLYKYARRTARWQAVRARIRELHGQGLRCPAIAAHLNAEGLRALTNELWRDNTVGIELQVLGLPKPRKWPPGQRVTVEAARKAASDGVKKNEETR